MHDLFAWIAVDAIPWLFEKPGRAIIALVISGLLGLFAILYFVG